MILERENNHFWDHVLECKCVSMDYIMNYLTFHTKWKPQNGAIKIPVYQYKCQRKGDNKSMIINPLPGDLVRKKSHCLKNTQICIHVYETTYSSFNKNVQ